MIDGSMRLAFSSKWEIEVVDGEGMAGFGPERSLIFHGAVFPHLYDAVRRGRSLSEAEACLREVATETVARDAMGRLWRSGLLVRAPEADGSGRGTVKLHRAPARLPSFRVAGDVDALPEWSRRLGAPGRTGSERPDVTVVLTLDYLSSPTLLSSLDVEGGVLLARPVGPAAWVGPWIRSDHAPCVACLRERLLAGRPLLAGLRQLPAWRPTGSHRALRPDADADVLVRHLRHVLSTGTEEDGFGLAGAIARVPLDGRPHTVHPIRPRPQCPVCGDPGLLRDRRQRRPVLHPTPVRASSTAGLRTETAAEFVARFQELLDPVTGLVRSLRRKPAGGNGHVRALMAGPLLHDRPDSLETLTRWLRAGRSGTGVTWDDARASALAEAAERYCTVFRGDEPRRTDTLEALGDDAIHPDEIMLFSQAQRRGKHPSGVHAPPELPTDAPIEWSTVWSLRDGSRRYVPTELLYYGYRSPAGHPTCARADSNGTAAGGTLADAVLQGMLELIERDAVAIWWHNRLERPRLTVEEAADGYVEEVRAELAAEGREFWILDVTTDLDVPALVAVSPRPTGGVDLGFGAHVVPSMAWRRATAELCQVIGFSSASRRAPARGEIPSLDAGLEPSGSTGIRRWGDVTPPGDILTVVRDLASRLAARGLDCLVVDLTRPDIGVPVARVLVPGLRSHRPRFAPGRLYEVPVQLGWRTAVLTEDQMRHAAVIPTSPRRMQ